VTSPTAAGGVPAELLARDFLARPAREVAPDLLGCVLEHETADGVVAVQLTEVEAYEGLIDPASHSYRGRTPRNAVMWGPPGFGYVYFTYGMYYCVNIVCQPAGTSAAVLIRAGRVVAGEQLARQRRAVRPRPPGASTPATTATPATSGPPATPGDTATRVTPERRIATRDLARGPGRLGQAMGITLAQNGLDCCDPDSPLRLRQPASLPATASPAAALPPAAPLPAATPPAATLPAAPLPAATPPAATPPAPRPGISSGPRVGVTAAAAVPWRFWLTGDPTVSAYRLHRPRPR
jgi:DNA-3-methyladenine glycosylase